VSISATRFPEIFAALASPFEPHEVKVRDGGQGRQLHYITARTAMNRLDTVLGPEAWEDEYYAVCNVLFCRLTITMPDGTKISKSDAGGFKQMETRERGQVVPDGENTDKTGASDAFKRAAAKFGIARYLYRDGVPSFFAGDAQPAPPVSPPRTAPPNGHSASRQGHGGAPRSGRALFAWSADEGKKNNVDLVAYLNKWGKLNEYPSRIVDWDEEQVAKAHAEAMRKLAAVDGGDAHSEAPGNSTPARPAAPQGMERAEQAARQRSNLVDLVRQIHELRTGSKTTPDPEFWAILDEIGTHHAGGEMIDDFQSCDDTRLLGRYVVGAGMIVQEAQSV
jgi:hypothetical protein